MTTWNSSSLSCLEWTYTTICTPLNPTQRKWLRLSHPRYRNNLATLTVRTWFYHIEISISGFCHWFHQCLIVTRDEDWANMQDVCHVDWSRTSTSEAYEVQNHMLSSESNTLLPVMLKNSLYPSQKNKKQWQTTFPGYNDIPQCWNLSCPEFLHNHCLAEMHCFLW